MVKRIMFAVIVAFWQLACSGMDRGSMNGVKPYCPIYEDQVRQIAIKELPRLTSCARDGHSDKDRRKIYEEQVLPVLGRCAKIYLHRRQCVGFVTYAIPERSAWGARVNRGPVAKVDHLAIDENQRGHGFGRALMETVIDDCRRQGAAVINLRSIDPRSGTFYDKFGFSAVRGTVARNATDHSLRLQPYVAERAIKAAIRFIKR